MEEIEEMKTPNSFRDNGEMKNLNLLLKSVERARELRASPSIDIIQVDFGKWCYRPVRHSSYAAACAGRGCSTA